MKCVLGICLGGGPLWVWGNAYLWPRGGSRTPGSPARTGGPRGSHSAA